MDRAAARPWHVVLLIVAALGAYANAIPGGFVYDDHILIEKDPRITGPLNVPLIFQTDYWGDSAEDGLYRPLTVLTFALDRAVFGTRPAAFHAVNVVLHAAVGVALFFLLLRLFRRPSLALVAALIFALHPVHTEAVTGVVGRAEVLAALFVILSLRFALPPVTPNRIGFSLVFFLLALLSKESSIVLLGLYPLTLVLGGAAEGGWRQRAPLVVFGCLAGVAALWFILRWRIIGSLLQPDGYVPLFLVNPLAHVGTADRILGGIAGLGRSMLLLVLPVNLSADYSYNQIPVGDAQAALPVVLSLAALAGLLGAAWFARRRSPALTLGIGWFLLAILPTTNLVFPIGTIFAERLLYLPSVGFCLVAALLWERASLGGGRRKGAAAAALVTVCMLLAAGTLLRNRDWRDDESLFRSVTENAPMSAKGYFELGVILQDRKDEEEAKRLYREATEIYPDYAQAHYNSGQIYRLQGEYDAAILDYMEAIRSQPDFAEAYHNLALSRARQGHLEEAVEDISEAVRLKPEMSAAWMDLALVLRELRRYEDAIGALQNLIELDPLNVSAHLQAAEIYISKLKDREKALHHLKKAIEIDPDHPDLKNLPGLLPLAKERKP